jgi:hypothetical protein
MPKKPRPIGEREQNLIQLYCYCQLRMTPQQFYAKWDVKYEVIALICSRSVSTVRRWFITGKYSRRPSSTDLHHLALMDFLLEHYEDIPKKLRHLLCSTNQGE